MSDDIQADLVKQDWANSKLCFSDLSKEDAQDLLKSVVLHSINTNPQLGFSNLTRLELLIRAFPQDGLLLEIHRQLHKRCNDMMVSLNDGRDVSSYEIMEHCFRGQPETFDNHGEGYKHWFKLDSDPIMKKLIIKYPSLKWQIREAANL